MRKKWSLKTLTKEILVASILLFILTNIFNHIRKPEPPSYTLPQLEIKLLDGSLYKIEKGKPTILHFWGTWCPTCQLEVGNIAYISQRYEVLTIAVNSGDDNTLTHYLDKRGITFRVVNDDRGKWAKSFNIKAYPTTLIYDSKGELRFIEVGYTTTAGLLARLALIDK